jgi:hypothetical protein
MQKLAHRLAYVSLALTLLPACGGAPASATPPASPVVSPTAPAPTVTPSPTAVLPPTATLAPTPHPAVDVIEQYLAARARVDTAAVEGLACAAWKPQARTEAASFRSMNAELVNVACAVTGTDGDAALVQCQGKIVTHYSGQTRDWPQDRFTYRVVNESGAWKMCGYK